MYRGAYMGDRLSEPILMGDRSTFGRASDRGLLILMSLAAGEKHGYALMQDIEAFAGITLRPGTLYGALSRLERHSLISAEQVSDRRRPYRITESGRAVLEAELTEAARITEICLRRIALNS